MRMRVQHCACLCGHIHLLMQSVETQLASVGNIMKSEHDIGMFT